MRNERPFILSASPIRARIERGARESIRRKPQIVNILERARTKLAAGKCGAPKLRLCVRRARCTRRTYFIARARLFSLAAWDFSSFRTRVRAPFYFVLFCPFFLLLFVSALLTCATLWSHRPSLLTRRFFSLSLRIFLSASLSLLSSSFFLRVVYSRTCQRINIFMKGLQCSLVGLFTLDMHVLSRAVLSRAPFVRSLSLFLCLVRYYSLFFY